ncbi:MAG TPA: hypothetical protein ENJ61_04660 [Aquifex aeolicus]|uniref:DUF86 domain-containing protein n=1 Tax=Aquifex aeolicus TaxID=63363 RepID=A0A7C5QEM1_AQUAO|nr:hypothetical protein [Aquifex aeolicus]
MREDVFLLEEMLLRTMLSEIEERYRKVQRNREGDREVLELAENLLRIGRAAEGVFRKIPNPRRKMGEDLYTTLYEVLKDISSALSELAIAGDDRIHTVVAHTYRRLDSLNSLFEKLT